MTQYRTFPWTVSHLIHGMLFPCVSADAFRWPDFEDRARSSPAVSAALWLRHVPVHGHREELQTYAGEAAAGGAVKPSCQQPAGGGWGRTGALYPPLQQYPVDPQLRPIQRPVDHPQPARDEPDQSILPGLLAVWRPTAGRPQGQRPEGAQGAEETPQPPASWGRGREGGAGRGRDMRSVDLCLKRPHPPFPPYPVKTGRDSLRVAVWKKNPQTWKK